jgi:hypothetical protein
MRSSFAAYRDTGAVLVEIILLVTLTDMASAKLNLLFAA